ncbi:hypothetical protein TNCV_987571 [Trichonephila clavipes]|nr:hypothetical protein TNCV_987571 [Trichonephila clavipes]
MTSSILVLSSSSTQVNLLMSTSSTADTMSESLTPIHMSIAAPSSTNITPVVPFPSITSNSLCSSVPLSLLNKTNISPKTSSKSDIYSTLLCI